MDEHIGIDYSLLRDPAVSTDTLDLDFKVNSGSCTANSPSALGVAVPAALQAPLSEPGELHYGCRNRSCSLPRACSSPVQERTRSWRTTRWSR